MLAKFLKSNALVFGTLLLCACATRNNHAATPPKATHFSSVAKAIQNESFDLETFASDGPFRYYIKPDIAIDLAGEPVILADLVLARVKAPAPLVIFSHGNHSHKEAHRYQAERLASWGIHALVLQLPNQGRWIKNGKTIYNLVRYLHESKSKINPKIDTSRIILAGHSFGGSAVTVAAGMGAPVLGIILLDPAMVHDKVKDYLQRLRVPAMLLGADQKVFRSRKRRSFYRYARSDIGEISVRGATHDDAQFPSMFALNAFGKDPFTSQQRQNIFNSAITATALSLATQSGLDFAWNTFDSAISAGLLKNPKRRAAAFLQRGERNDLAHDN